MVGFIELRAANFESWRESARAWRTTAGKLAELENTFRTGVNDGVEAAGWKGQAAGTADQDLEVTVRQIAVSASQAQTIAIATERAASELPAIQTMFRAAIQEAETSGLQIVENPGGYTVQAAGPPEAAGNPTPADAARQQSAIDGFVARFDTLLRQASEADAKFAATLTTLMPADVAETRLDAWQNSIEDTQRVAGLYGVGPVPTLDPTQTAAWWRGLSDEQRALYLAAYPRRLGSMDGLPAAVRDTANRTALDQRLTELAPALAGGKSPNHDKREWENLTEIKKQLVAGYTRPPGKELLLLKFGDKFLDGQVIMSVGDPDKAKNVSISVPGTDATVTNGLEGGIKRIDAMQHAVDTLTPGGSSNVASVFWLDYDAPEKGASGLSGSMIGWDRSQEGASRLNSFVNGVRAQGNDHHITMIAHSYGTTVVGDAARAGSGLAVDDVVSLGSPGMHVKRAQDLHMDPTHVWAERAVGTSKDTLVVEGGAYSHGADHKPGGRSLVDTILGEGSDPITPTDKEFGGNVMSGDAHAHDEYWNPGSESLTNQAKIVMGMYNDPNPLQHPKLK
ncbi:alpha/beta hydrolase [Embleya sp. NPDC020630]|uniref:alpha/beta hydrolase n=1 Tax=Embleya sp. NPDC020630 TaxID=3363979 RepID=UPI003793B418